MNKCEILWQVAAWAERSNLPIVFAENSGADLSSIQAKVPQTRSNFEFLHIPVTSRARVEIGIHEALGVIEAVKVCPFHCLHQRLL